MSREIPEERERLVTASFQSALFISIITEPEMRPGADLSVNRRQSAATEALYVKCVPKAWSKKSPIASVLSRPWLRGNAALREDPPGPLRSNPVSLQTAVIVS